MPLKYLCKARFASLTACFITLLPTSLSQVCVVFFRTDLGEGKCVKALAENVTSTARSTTISDGEVSVTTIEHLMSALTGMGVDNAFVEIDNIEVPILDGSALPYAREILKDGTVEIRAIAREAGSRTKIAVSSNEPNVDPVGACVGINGSRVNAVVDELRGEKIDIINWDDNPAYLIENALSPAKVICVVADEEGREAQVIVPDYQLSLAIGKEGQNARLAAKLTGFKIDIKSETQARESGLFDELGIDYQMEGAADFEEYEEPAAEETTEEANE